MSKKSLPKHRLISRTKHQSQKVILSLLPLTSYLFDLSPPQEKCQTPSQSAPIVHSKELEAKYD